MVLNTNIKAPSGYKIVWSNDTEGTSCTFERIEAKEKTVQAKLVRISDNTTVKETRVETIKVNTGFFSKLAAFFRELFGQRVTYTNNVKVK